MMQAAAMILGLSLMVAGLSLVGVAAGWWEIPDDIWGAILVLLGVAGRYVTTRATASAVAAPPDDPPDEATEEPPGDPPDEPERSNGKKAAISGLILLAFVPAACLDGCSSPQLRADAAAWAQCTGGGALSCIPHASGDDPSVAALNYTACLVQRGVACVAPLVARSNPPGPAHPLRHVDEGCLSRVASRCLLEARRDHSKIGRYDSVACVTERSGACFVP